MAKAPRPPYRGAATKNQKYVIYYCGCIDHPLAPWLGKQLYDGRIYPPFAGRGHCYDPHQPTFWSSARLMMDKLKQFFLKACRLPQTICHAYKERGLQTIRNEREAERLDRIRNPSKYLGK